MQVIIYGLGTIGSNLFVQLIRQFPDWKYTGVDFDKVEDRNLRVQAYFKEHVKAAKASALASIGARYVYNLKYLPLVFKVEIPLTPEISYEYLYIDCFDNTASRKLLNVKNGANILHLGFSPLYAAECIWDEKYDPPNDISSALPDICQMTDAIGFIHFFLGAVTMVISEWAETRVKKSFIITNKNKMVWI
jgi:molybdopterin/thiamine biosynthesis adenylyltransferase